jgi:hypothetical protein
MDGHACDRRRSLFFSRDLILATPSCDTSTIGGICQRVWSRLSDAQSGEKTSRRRPRISLSLSSDAHSRSRWLHPGGKVAAHKSAYGFVGQITSPPCLDLLALSSPSSKNISVFQKRKSGYMICHPVPLRGALAIVTNVGAGSGGRGSARAQCVIAGRILSIRERSDGAQTNGAAADGESVWS